MMTKVGLFYGTQTESTQTEAEVIRKEFGGDSVIELIDVSKSEISDFDRFEYIIIGCPTWNVGQLQSDWKTFYDELDEIDFTGKKVAYFGPRDHVGYSDSFKRTSPSFEAVGILEERISKHGGTTVGYWPAEGYEFTESKGFRDGKFIGLPLDEANESNLTDGRIKTWVAQLKKEFGL
jgi:flavodoxin I